MAAAVGFTDISYVPFPSDNPPENHAASCHRTGPTLSPSQVRQRTKEKRTKEKGANDQDILRAGLDRPLPLSRSVPVPLPLPGPVLSRARGQRVSSYRNPLVLRNRTNDYIGAEELRRVPSASLRRRRNAVNSFHLSSGGLQTLSSQMSGFLNTQRTPILPAYLRA